MIRNLIGFKQYFFYIFLVLPFRPNKAKELLANQKNGKEKKTKEKKWRKRVQEVKPRTKLKILFIWHILSIFFRKTSGNAS
jgi:hypothetical protein